MGPGDKLNKADCTRKLSRRRLAMYERYVLKLRYDDHDKLTRFCKMHLSFLLDMDNEKFEALFGEKMDQKTKLGHRITKRKSTTNKGDMSVLCERITIPPGVESAVARLSTYLLGSQHLGKEGIFRKSGNISRQKQLKESLLSSNTYIDLSTGTYTTHDCASTLKSMLTDLPEPLFLERLFGAHLSTSDIRSDERRCKVICLLIQMLPSSHYKLAHTLFNLLHKVSLFRDQNKMNSDNLGAIFAPHILPSKKMSSSDLHNYTIPMQECVSFIITHTQQIFSTPEMLALDVINHIKKLNITMSTSEDSIISLDSVDSGSRKHKLSDDDDEAIETVLTFATRSEQNPRDTEVELAKLYAHVQSMPDSAKKRKLLRQFSEANGYHKQVEVKRKHSRSRSFGHSIRRRFSKKGKSLNLNESLPEQDHKNTAETSNNPVKLFTNRGPASTGSEPVQISSLSSSPYPLHKYQTSLRNLRQHAHNNNLTHSLSQENRPTSMRTPDIEPITPMPAIRKTLLPTTFNTSTPDNRVTAVKRTQEYVATPPRPKSTMSVLDSSIRV